MVGRATASAIPTQHQKLVREDPTFGPSEERIDRIPEADQTAPRTHWHIAYRIWASPWRTKQSLGHMFWDVFPGANKVEVLTHMTV